MEIHMQDKQTTLNLLETIRDVLNHEIFPNVQPNQANTAKMVKSGLNIVIRNLKKGSRTTINTKRQDTSSGQTCEYFIRRKQTTQNHFKSIRLP